MIQLLFYYSIADLLGSVFCLSYFWVEKIIPISLEIKNFEKYFEKLCNPNFSETLQFENFTQHNYLACILFFLGHLIKNFCDTKETLLYDASFLNHDRRTDPKSINAISRLAQTVVNTVGVEEARKLFRMRSGKYIIYGSFCYK